MGTMGPWQILLILAVILLLFGAARLPALAKSIGQSARAFRGEMKQLRNETEAETPADAAPENATPAPATATVAESAPTPDAHRTAQS